MAALACRANGSRLYGKPLQNLAGNTTILDQIVAAVRGKGGTAWHLLARNEGHGFAKKENADYQFWTALQFWQKTLLN